MKIAPTLLAVFAVGSLAACQKPVDGAGANIQDSHDNAADVLDNKAEVLEDKADAVHNQADQLRQWGKDEKKAVDKAERAGVNVSETVVNKM